MRIHRRALAPAPPMPDRRLPPSAAAPPEVRRVREKRPRRDTIVLRRACVPTRPTCSAAPAARPTQFVRRTATPEPAMTLLPEPGMLRLTGESTLPEV